MNFNLTNVKSALKLYELCHDATSGHNKVRIIGRGQTNDVLRSKLVESWTTLAVERGMMEALDSLKTDALRRIVFPKMRSWNRMVHRLDKLTERGPKLCDDVLTVYVFICVLNIIVVVEVFYIILLVKKCICKPAKTEESTALLEEIH
uniref:Uncharacterized protein n=1 Tax=Lygus hesperus TaxID=30085 RepID=A0A0A9YIS4_LYGHE